MQELAQLDALAARKLEADGVSGRVRVVRFRAGGERMDHLVLADIGLREPGADPERLAPRVVRNVANRAEVSVTVVQRPRASETRSAALSRR